MLQRVTRLQVHAVSRANIFVCTVGTRHRATKGETKVWRKGETSVLPVESCQVVSYANLSNTHFRVEHRVARKPVSQHLGAIEAKVRKLQPYEPSIALLEYMCNERRADIGTGQCRARDRDADTV